MINSSKSNMDYIQEYFDKDADSRVKNWVFMSTPLPTILVSILYVIVAKKIGPNFMENRKPFQLNNIIIVYNAAQVYLSAYIFYKMSVYGWMILNNTFCEPVDLENNELLISFWWYYFSKFTEFFDTFFFILRKKMNQVSVLHVFHHAIMPPVSWFALKYSPGGTASIFPALNTFVHIIMYSYYLFAAMGPEYQKYLWWKKYLTIIQLVQFVIVMVIDVNLIINDCKINKTFLYLTFASVFVIMLFFANFYIQTYRAKPKIQVSLNENSDCKNSDACLKYSKELYKNNYLKPKTL